MRYIGKKCLMILMCIGILTGCGSGRDTDVYLEEESQQDICDMQQPADKTTETELTVTVYVCGAVRHPGVYTLEDGLRIADAIEAAGGFKKSASRNAWNLAEKLTDGNMYTIPTKEEADAVESADSGDGHASQVQDDKVHINTAGIEELMKLPGVGQARAEAIISYREEHGTFVSPEDIMKVSGIKTALFEKMKDNIAVD
ncbi:MAG: helix-hairpin-helix domain-containing protein [Lachnobacterium sp.]|nr:helix-hairpin-helix domain-containing protein [Lachnobacterium sp.]